MIILSFAMTTAALVNLEKTVTRREWSDAYAERFRRSIERAGGLAQAWSASPHRKGRKVGEVRVLSVVKEPTREVPDSDWEAEGFAFMERNGLNLGKDLTCERHWRRWREGDGEAHTIRFEVVSLVCEDCERSIKVPDEGVYDAPDRAVLCYDCYGERTFECCRCGEWEYDDHRGAIDTLLALVKEDETGLPNGLYRVVRHPYYWSGILSMGLCHEAIKRVGDVPEGIDADGYPVGHLCRECSGKLLAKTPAEAVAA